MNADDFAFTALQCRYNELMNEVWTQNQRHAEQCGRLLEIALRAIRQRDAAVKAARRWKEKAQLEHRLASYLNRAVKRLREKAEQ
jgi:hypothetical protein